jgi:hypothetical protein
VIEDMIRHGHVIVRLPCMQCCARGEIVGISGDRTDCPMCKGTTLMEVRLPLEELIEHLDKRYRPEH